MAAGANSAKPTKSNLAIVVWIVGLSVGVLLRVRSGMVSD
jgi:hypothetical protein